MSDPGDVILRMAQRNEIPSGPGGTIRDRAIQLARGGMDVSAAITQAISETEGRNHGDVGGNSGQGGTAAGMTLPADPVARLVAWAQQNPLLALSGAFVLGLLLRR